MTHQLIPLGGFSHQLDLREERAIQAALAAERPLLVRGEPGVGKTQLARAAAVMLKRPLVSMAVDGNTDARELMWSFDAVQRLAEAQVAAATERDEVKLRDRVDMKRFVRPGPLWWAFSWETAIGQLNKSDVPPETPDDWSSEQGVVILIDEIDKAGSEVPNGLLEAFGMRQFLPQGWTTPIRQNELAQPPLIVLTTNEERRLPDAFVRRCLVLHLDLPEVSPHAPKNKEQEEQEKLFIQFLADRGAAHFPSADPEILQDAARLLLEDRRYALQQHLLPLPGQAEYLDFLRIALTLGSKSGNVREVFKQVRGFVFQKSRKPQR